MNQASPLTGQSRLIDLRGKRVSQEMLSQVDLRQCLLGLSLASRIGIFFFSLLLGVLCAVVAAIAGGRLALDLGFLDQLGRCYVTIATVAIILAAFVFWAHSQWMQSILVALVGCWLGLPILVLVVLGYGDFMFLIPLVGTLLTACSLLSLVGLSLTSSLLAIGFQRQFRWFQGLLLGSFMVLCGAMGVILATSGILDNEHLDKIRPTAPMIVSMTGFIGWLGSSVLAVAIALVILRLRQNNHLNPGQPDVILALGKAIANLGGTSFRELDLSQINFSGTSLANIDLRATKLYRTRFSHTTAWEAATVDNSYLDLHQPQVQSLLAGEPKTKNFCRTNLRGAYLQGANLEDFDFTEAILDGADFRGANLRYAKFVRSLVTNVDFSQADLTGCCVRDWSFNRHTCFQGVICDYIYRDFEDGKPEQRYPLDRNFLPGEFEAIVRKLETSYELVFEQEIDPISLSFVFEKFRLEDESLGLELQGLEQRGDLWIVKVGHREGVSRSQVVERVNETYEELRQMFEARYQLALEAKEGEIARLNSYYQLLIDMYGQFLQKLVERTGSSAAIYLTNQVGKIMENQNISAGGNVDASTGAKITAGRDITGSTINLGEISGNVSNVVNQLPSSPDPTQPGIKELLLQLQKAIDEDTDLPSEDKADLLEQVKALAEAEQTPEPEKKKGLARNAKKIFDATLKSLPDTANIIEACSKLLPLILKTLGFPA
ncbi:pentapeptide repeat-containing protein [Nostoc sp. FACHB-152]|uniref:pentapeptide repeat-containing protein n=1 Tax=unclassified Nostoc TaxID=2593658 RepID=UPI00168740B0|nr:MULTISPECIES: pentapeptide repeat-containing protein [unclassified Nostoc]MBD2445701.1 pentapeptide repeat-containing protein [Nostoc sp. FACHB-152]MBD2466815.1 pentapeptide repeat-containing protein [Nostoc sp. FACHB-145]